MNRTPFRLLALCICLLCVLPAFGCNRQAGGGIGAGPRQPRGESNTSQSPMQSDSESPYFQNDAEPLVPATPKYQTDYYDLFDTHTSLTIYTESKKEFDRYAKLIHDEMLRLHQLFDIYNDYEGIANIKTINESAGISPVVVDPAVIDLLLFAVQADQDTQGSVNVALGPVLRIWHSYREAALENPEDASLPAMEELAAAAAHISMAGVIIDKEASTVYLREPGMSLDVGAIAKGFAAQRAVDLARDAGMTSGLLNAGGNVVAVGTPADGRSAWNVGVQSPADSEDLFDVISLCDMAAVSSGDYQRFYEVDGRQYHHIIDPATLFPAGQVRATTILHPDAATADLLSTAAFILPYEQARELVERYGAMGIWIFADGSARCTDSYKAVSENLR